MIRTWRYAAKTPEGDFRSNVSAGGTTVHSEVDDTMLNLVDQIRPKLLQDGVFLVGLNIVGDKLMEVNVFSPGGIYEAVEVEGIDFYEPIITALERKVHYKKLYGDRISNRELAVMV